MSLRRSSPTSLKRNRAGNRTFMPRLSPAGEPHPQRALRRTTATYPLREPGHGLVRGSVNLVEPLGPRDQVWPFHAPVRLLRLELEVHRVGQSLVQQVHRLTTGGFGDVVEGWVGDARPGSTPVSGA